MKRRNTMSIGQYVLGNFVWGGVTALLFWELCMAYFSVPGTSILFNRNESILWLTLLQLGGVTLGCLLTLHTRRNQLSLLSNVSLPLGVYALCVLMRQAPWLPMLMIGLAAVLSVVYVWLVFTHKMPVGNHMVVLRRRREQCAYGSRVICSMCTLVLVGALICSETFHMSLTNNNQMVEAMGTQNKMYTLESQRNNLKLLNDAQWTDAPVADKLKVLNVVARIEADYLGTPPVQVYGTYMNMDTQGKYDPKNEKIYINLQIINSHYSSQALRTVLHEMYHHYQHTLCDMYEDLPPQYRDLQMFESVQQYQKEFKDYDDGSSDYEEYYDQEVERSAREYAEQGAVEYLEFLRQEE